MVDGLADVCSRDRAAAQELVELLPFGRAPFRFLLSGEIDELLQSTGCSSRSYPITLFSIEESRQLFSGLDISDDAIARAHNSCNGVVGQLAAVRRLFMSGLRIDEILEKQPGELANTMLLEWERAPRLTLENPEILAVLAFDARRHSAESLARASGTTPTLVAEVIRSATFLSQNSDGTIEFISETFRTFAQRRLDKYRQATLERLIAAMLPNPVAADSVTALPTLMSEAKQFREVISLLDADYFGALVAATESVGAVNAQAIIGAKSAERAGDDAAIYRFRLIQSLAADVLRSGGKHNEVAALISVGQTNEALGIARAAAFREERLRLLASALAGLVDRGDDVDTSLRDELRQLCTSAAIDTMADDIVEVAGDVFAVDPEAALQLVERFGRVTKRAHVFDWVMAAMSVRHTIKGRKAHAGDSEVTNIHHRIADPALRTVFEAVGLGNLAHDADWILERSRQVTDPINRVSVLRMWLEMNRQRPDAIRVATFALDLAVKTREYAPTVPVLRQFASALPYTMEREPAAEVIGRIDALLSSLPHRSPSIEYTRIQLLLARAQAKFGFDGARLRVVELYLFVGQLSDLSVKAECMARLYAWLPILEPGRDHEDVRKQLSTLIEEVLRNSAAHDDVLLPILRPLTKTHAVLAFDVVEQLNIDVRRDDVRGWLIEECASDASVGHNTRFLVEQLARISDPRVRARTVIRALASATRREALRVDDGATSTPAAVPLAQAMWEHASELTSPEDRAMAFAYMSRALDGTPSSGAALKKLKDAIDAIRIPAHRAQTGFIAVRELAAVNRPAAEQLLGQVRSDQESRVLPASAVSGFALATRLACRALRGVFGSDRAFDVELGRVFDMCDRIPDIFARVIILSELCFAAGAEGRTDIGDRIHERLWSALQEAKDESLDRYWRCLAVAGWSLFLRHERAFNAALTDLPEPERERIVRGVVSTLIHGVPPTEPGGDTTDLGRELSHKQCTDLRALLHLVCDDSLIFRTIRAVSRSASKRDTRLTREQKTELQHAFASLVEEKLPCPNKIRHDGYKWACVAELMRMTDDPEIRWRELVGYAAQVPNIPDAAYTLALVASAMSSKYHNLRRETIQSALTVARTVKITSERGECLLNLADEVWRIDSQLAKQVLREAAETMAGLEKDDEEDGRIDRLLDIAYRISADFALALSSELDFDTARSEARRGLLLARKTIEARTRMLDDSDEPASTLGQSEGETLAQAAWRNLAALNASSVAAKAPRALRKSLGAASQWPLETTYPVFAWAVQNWVDRPAAKPQKGASLRELAQASMLAAELVRLLVSDIVVREPMTEVEDLSVRSLVVIRPGARRKAIEIIRDWCGRVSMAYLKISDQYFGPDDLDLLKIVAEHEPSCRIQILTSQKHLRQLKLQAEWVDAFADAWSRISITPLPPTDITVAGVPPSGKSPLHDRWWIAGNSALDFGTSANSLGVGQGSAVKECDATVAAEMEACLDKYLLRVSRWTDAGRISYISFSL